MSPSRAHSVQPVAQIVAHWRVIGVTCFTALIVSLTATALVPKKYTAVTRIFIEPPAGSDPRSATTVSPIYLESLRTYELFASSDTLFLQAVERFHLRQNDTPVDRLKKSVLKVEVVRNTKVLDISATLRDPRVAHDLALYLAQETVAMNDNTTRQGDQEFVSGAERQYTAARLRMDAAQQAWDAAPEQVTAEGLRSEIAADEYLRDGLKKEMTELEVTDPDVSGPDARTIAAYRRRLATLTEQITAKRKQLAAATARIESLQSDLGAARRIYAGLETRLQELRGAAGYRGERLRIIDPGIVPERPSSPDLILNLLVALVAGLVLSVGGLLVKAVASPEEDGSSRRPLAIVAK